MPIKPKYSVYIVSHNYGHYVEQAIQSATETATMILRIDDVISSKGVSMGGEGMMDGMDF